MPTVRPRETGPALEAVVLALLVCGWSGDWDLPSDADPWAVFDVRDEDLHQLYQTHRAAVEAEAHRRGLPQSWAKGRGA